MSLWLLVACAACDEAEGAEPEGNDTVSSRSGGAAVRRENGTGAGAVVPSSSEARRARGSAAASASAGVPGDSVASSAGSASAGSAPAGNTAGNTAASASAGVPGDSVASAAANASAGSAAAGNTEQSCPSEMAQVGKVCVDRWEAHLVTTGGAAHPATKRPELGVAYAARSRAGTKPQAYVNKREARAACEAAGKRLCTLGEWYDACRGSKKTTFPYGWTYRKGVCNAGKPHLLGKLFGDDPKLWTYDEHFNSPKLNEEEGFLSLTGAFAECRNDYGLYDMVGNLHEWVSDEVTLDLGRKVPLRDDIRDKLRRNLGHSIFMGGFYSTTGEHGEGCTFTTIGHGPKYHDYSTGFRCCRNAEE